MTTIGASFEKREQAKNFGDALTASNWSYIQSTELTDISHCYERLIKSSSRIKPSSKKDTVFRLDFASNNDLLTNIQKLIKGNGGQYIPEEDYKEWERNGLIIPHAPLTF